MLISRTSPLTGKVNTMDLNITPEQLERFNKRHEQRVLAQDALPHLSPAEREFLMTGYTQEDWDKMFPPEDDK